MEAGTESAVLIGNINKLEGGSGWTNRIGRRVNVRGGVVVRMALVVAQVFLLACPALSHTIIS